MQDSPSSRKLIMQETAEMRAALDERLIWQWDDHNHALLAEFSVDHAESVMYTLKQHFPFHWDKKTIKKASATLRHRAAKYACLDNKQQLMCRDQTGDHEIMLAWWPWGHGATVSVRIFRATSQAMPERSSFSKWVSTLFNLKVGVNF